MKRGALPCVVELQSFGFLFYSDQLYIIGVPWMRQLRLDYGSRDLATRGIESTQKQTLSAFVAYESSYL